MISALLLQIAVWALLCSHRFALFTTCRCAGNELWYLVLSLLSCYDVAIKARALHLLGLSLSTQDGQVGRLLTLSCGHLLL